MTLNIDFPPPVSARLDAFARQRGLAPEAAVEQIVAEYLPPTGADAPGPDDAPTLADLLGDLLGSTAGSGANNSDDTGQKFAAHLAQKHQENRL